MNIRNITEVTNLRNLPDLKIMKEEIGEQRGWFAFAKGHMYLYTDGEMRKTAADESTDAIAFFESKERILSWIESIESSIKVTSHGDMS